MLRIPDVFRANPTLFNSATGFLVVALVLFSEGCSKAPLTNERSANVANSNQKDEIAATQPLLQPTLTGDVERISLAISMARDALKAEVRIAELQTRIGAIKVNTYAQ